MRTEEYIIILVGVVAENNEVRITYTSNAPESKVSIKLVYSNGKTVKTFDQVKPDVKGVLTTSSEGFMPGSYTCAILVDGQVRDSKIFAIA
jgi:flagellar hook assembly protein FlgD